MNSSPAVSVTSFSLNAPAKINWALYVLSKRDDGFHDIFSLMHCISLHDTLVFERSERIELASDMDIPTGQNLVYRAAEALREHAGIGAGARITLEKNIPHGAGLGGGSSDAACALKGLNRLWGLGLHREELRELGGRLGSDVPFFFECPAAFAEGRGEKLVPAAIDSAYTLLLVKPPTPVATAWAYKEIDAGRYGEKAARELTKTGDKIDNIKLIFKALKVRDMSALRAIIHNDFEDIVFKAHPDIRILKERLLEAGAAVAAMSGSGSAVFGLFEDRDEAVRAAACFSGCWNMVVETLTSVNSR